MKSPALIGHAGALLVCANEDEAKEASFRTVEEAVAFATENNAVRWEVLAPSDDAGLFKTIVSDLTLKEWIRSLLPIGKDRPHPIWCPDKQSPWSTMQRRLSDNEWNDLRAWLKSRSKSDRLQVGDVDPRGRVFIGYSRNYRGGERWGSAIQLQLTRLRGRDHARNRRLIPEVLAEINKSRRNKYATDPIFRHTVREQYKKYKRTHRPELAALNLARHAKNVSRIHPCNDMQKERDVFTTARRLTKSTGILHTVDHIIPLNFGGWHHHDNLQALPQSVNSSKSDDPFWTSDHYKDWRNVPRDLWPEELAEEYRARMVLASIDIEELKAMGM